MENSIINWWSGGITSAVACKVSQEKYGDRCRNIFLDTGNEHEDTERFMGDCEKWYGQKIEILKSDKYNSIQDVWYKHNSLNTANGAVCSYMLKRVVREKWEKKNSFSHQVFGFEFDKKEIQRAKSMSVNHPHIKPLYPLIDSKLTKPDCLRMVEKAGIVIPTAYFLGFQNNNCLKTGCVQGGIGYWQKIMKENPDMFDSMAKVEHDLTNNKGKPVTMLKDQSNKAKETGISLVFLKPHPDYPDHKSIKDMKGQPVKPLTDCNSFCGVNDLLRNSETENEINYEGSLF